MAEPLKAFVCGTDLTCELQVSEMLGAVVVTPNAEFALGWPCADECGVAEVEIRFVRWLKEPTMFKPKPAAVSVARTPATPFDESTPDSAIPKA